jgi:pimeloyl-ACP methyl ester carboxylesterase
MSPEEHTDFLMLLTMSEEFWANADSVAWMKRMNLRNPNPQTTEGFLRQFDACGRHDVRDRLGELSVPTHVIGAEHDQMVPPWKSTELAEVIPGARLTMLERAPHMVNIESAERFNQAVLEFLAEHAQAKTATA